MRPHRAKMTENLLATLVYLKCNWILTNKRTMIAVCLTYEELMYSLFSVFITAVVWGLGLGLGTSGLGHITANYCIGALARISSDAGRCSQGDRTHTDIRWQCNNLRFCFLSKMKISLNFARLHIRLFAQAHIWLLSTLADRKWTISPNNRGTCCQQNYRACCHGPTGLSKSPAFHGLQLMQISKKCVSSSVKSSDHKHFFLGCWKLWVNTTAYFIWPADPGTQVVTFVVLIGWCN